LNVYAVYATEIDCPEGETPGYIPDKVVHRIWGKMEKN
jgi:hypothetical protein